MEYKFVEVDDEKIGIKHLDLRARVWLERNTAGWALRWSDPKEGGHRFDWPHYARMEEHPLARAQLVLNRALAEHQLHAPSWDQILQIARKDQ